MADSRDGFYGLQWVHESRLPNGFATDSREFATRESSREFARVREAEGYADGFTMDIRNTADSRVDADSRTDSHWIQCGFRHGSGPTWSSPNVHRSPLESSPSIYGI